MWIDHMKQKLFAAHIGGGHHAHPGAPTARGGPTTTRASRAYGAELGTTIAVHVVNAAIKDWSIAERLEAKELLRL
jgi:hypothetical protein